MAEIDQKEELIAEISNEIDEFLVELATKHKEHPLNLSAIALARLMMLCNTTGCLDQFKQIMEDISGDMISMPTANTEVTKH